MKTRFKPILSPLLILSALEGAFCLMWMASIPADGKNSVFLGFSAQRLLMMAGVLFLDVLLVLAVFALKQNFKWVQVAAERLEKLSATTYFLGIVFILALALINLLLVPDYRWAKNVYLFERLRPLIIWLTLISTQTFLLLAIGRYSRSSYHLKDFWRQERRFVFVVLSALCFFMLLWAWMHWSGMGIVPDVSFWNDPGVPLLAFQVLISVLLGTAFYFFESRYLCRCSETQLKRWDVWIALIVFGTAAALWILTPQSASYFAPGPYPPAAEFYPFSDAANYDLSAQMAAIGRGYYSTFACPDKPLYLMLLTWLHLIAGDRFSLLIALQTGLFAILPVLLYLIGAQLGRRSIGLAAAFLSVFKEINALSSATLISTSTSKMMMSEVPTAILLACFTLVLLKWVKSDVKPLYLAALLGGINGLATLVRLNTFIFLPLSLLIFALLLFRRWKKLLLSAGVFGLVFLVSITPWAIRSQMVCHVNPFYYFTGPLQGVIINNRFSLSNEAPVTRSTQTNTPQAPQNLVGTVPVEESPVLPYGDDPSTQQTHQVITPAGKPALDALFRQMGSAGDKLQFIFNHFFHNLLATVLILPSTWTHDTLAVIAAPTGTFWADDWNGGLNPITGVLLGFNLAVLALGISLAWRHLKLAGLAPLAVYLVYNLGLAVARTSGGRYIVSAEWVVFVYYAAGIVVLTGWLLNLLGLVVPEKLENVSPVHRSDIQFVQPGKTAAVFCVFLLLGGLIPLTEKLIPAQNYEKPALSTWVETGQAGGYDKPALQQLLTSGCDVHSGKLVYPRFFFFGQNIPSGVKENVRLYPRLVFNLLTPEGSVIKVVLPATQIPYDLINGSQVSVLGCFSSDEYLEAIMIMKGDAVFYRDPPATDLKCPLPPISCDNNHVCH